MDAAAIRDRQPETAEGLRWDIMQILGDSLPGGVVGIYLEEGLPFYYVSAQMLHYLGYSCEELMEATDGFAVELIWPDDRERVVSDTIAAFSTGTEYRLEYRMRKKDGSPLWVRDCGRKTVAEDGRPLLLSACIDITETVDMRLRIEAKRREYDRLTDSLPCGICKVKRDESMTLRYANRFFYGIFGYSPEEALEAGFVNARFVHTSDVFETIRENIESAIAQGQTRFEVEHEAVTHSGKPLWLLGRCDYDPEEPDYITCVLLDITSRKQAEERLRISEQESQLLIQQSGKMICKYDIATRVLYQSRAAASIFALEEVCRNAPESVIATGCVPEECADEYRAFYQSMVDGKPTGRIVLKMVRPTGESGWFEAQYSLIYTDKGVPLRAIISSEEVTRERERELAYEKWYQHFEAQRKDCIAYYEFDLTKNQYISVEGRLTLEIPEEDRSFSAVARYAVEQFIYHEDCEAYREVLNLDRLLEQYRAGKRQLQFEHRRKGSAGEPFWAQAVIQLVNDPYSGSVKAYILIVDIDAKKQEALKLQRLSETDALTGLMNRRTVTKRITHVLKYSKEEAFHAFVMIDLDHFKQLNDSRGHQYGDFVLKELSDLISSSIRSEDFFGRMGGDEFILFLQNVQSETNAERLFDRITAALSRKLQDGTGVSASMGVACWPRDGCTFGELYHKADIALYRAKKRGRCQYAFYQEKRERPHRKDDC